VPVQQAPQEMRVVVERLNGLFDRLEQAFKREQATIANIAHELRTPVAIIRGEADVTLRRAERTPQEYREALTVIHGESVRLSRIVDDLFLLARVDAGGQANRDEAFRREPVRISDLVQDVIRSVRSLADAQQVSLAIGTAAGAPSFVRGDAMLLRRLLLNLLDNALKHAPSGSTITLAEHREGDAVHLRIADEGHGIAPDQRERVFERFVHGTQTAHGAGLGLAIAQAVAQAHGGRITLLDTPRGATFEVALPLIPTAGDQP